MITDTGWSETDERGCWVVVLIWAKAVASPFVSVGSGGPDENGGRCVFSGKEA